MLKEKSLDVVLALVSCIVMGVCLFMVEFDVINVALAICLLGISGVVLVKSLTSLGILRDSWVVYDEVDEDIFAIDENKYIDNYDLKSKYYLKNSYAYIEQRVA